MPFKELGLGENILKAIADCGYEEPTPIQKEAIPSILMMRDVVGLAQTGTGKTASFTLPMIEILHGGRAKARMPRSLVLTPTRELAAQVAENFDTYGKYTKLEKALLVGGVSMDEQIKKLDRGVDVLIATPGRLLDLFERGKILLTDIKVLVIDEADRMMDMGFIPDIEKIVSLLPFTRQTLLFSATMPPEIKKLTQKFQSNPKTVSVAKISSTADKVEQFIVWADPKKKKEALGKILAKEDVQNAFIFCNRKRDIASVAKWLKQNNYNAGEMHGDMAQSLRTKTLEEFKDGEIALLVCSDVAARGIDVTDLSHVFNFDVPMNAEDYVHRIGRTGRAGKTGRAWMLATKSEDKYVNAIERLIKESIEVSDLGSKPKGSGGAERSEQKSSRGGKGGSDKRGSNKSDSKPKSQDRGQSKSKPPHKKQHSSGPVKPDESHRNKGHKEHQNKSHEQDDSDDSDKGFGDEVPSFFGKV